MRKAKKTSQKILLNDEVEEAIRIFPRIIGFILQDDQYRCKDFELTISQFRFLRILHEQGPSSMSKLSEALRITPPSATVTADDLVNENLVSRKEDTKDRRMVQVSLTGKGANLMELFHQAKKKKWFSIMQSLNNSDRIRLLTTLRRLLLILEKSAAKQPK